LPLDVGKTHLTIAMSLKAIEAEYKKANMFFQLISTLHEQLSTIITSNKEFEDWTELLEDDALTTAVLDRPVHKCELFNMKVKSYRLENRQSIF